MLLAVNLPESMQGNVQSKEMKTYHRCALGSGSWRVMLASTASCPVLGGSMKDVLGLLVQRGQLAPVVYAQLFDPIPMRDWIKATMLKYWGLAVACGEPLQDLLEEFYATYHTADPCLTYHGRSGDKNRCEVVEENSVTLTCRTLTLDRFLRLGKPKGMLPPNWCSMEGPDNYTSCLGIGEDELEKWSGRKILDIGCGQSLFASEAYVFGIEVIGADLMVGEFQKRPLLCQYAKNMLFLAVLQAIQVGTDPGVLQCAEVPVLQRLWFGFPKIFRHYSSWTPQRADVCALSTTFAVDTFDVCLSSYLFCYLSKPDKIEALRNIALVTKVGGEIRICAGMSGITSHTSFLPEPTEIQLDSKKLVLGTGGESFRTYLVCKI